MADTTQGLASASTRPQYVRVSAPARMNLETSRVFAISRRGWIKQQQKKLVEKTRKAADRFHRELLRPTLTPSLLGLMVFRLSRTNIKALDTTFRDYQYYRDKGWFEADYYYPTSLGLAKRAFGSLFDFIGRQMVKRQ